MRTPGEPNAVDSAVEVAALRSDNLPSAARALAGAFHSDPMMRYLMPDDARRARALPLYFGSVLRVARREGVIEVAGRGGAEAAIVAMPPGTYPVPLAPQLREFRTFLAFGWTATLRNFRDLPPIERAHPAFPFWYIMYLGVSPAVQRGGLGGALLSRAIERADAQHLPVYLVTMKPENLAYYARFGFAVRQELRLGKSGPATWTLLRETKGAG